MKGKKRKTSANNLITQINLMKKIINKLNKKLSKGFTEDPLLKVYPNLSIYHSI